MKEKIKIINYDKIIGIQYNDIVFTDVEVDNMSYDIHISRRLSIGQLLPIGIIRILRSVYGNLGVLCGYRKIGHMKFISTSYIRLDELKDMNEFVKSICSRI